MITVIAGVNGAGKSSIVGNRIRKSGGDYFNPDEIAKSLIKDTPTLSQTEANSQAWKMGYDKLVDAIAYDKEYIFETTLGGNSIAQRLFEAANKGIQVNILYVGLSSPELHLERIAHRVSKGGHNIPEQKVRERYIGSIHNMMTLLPVCNQIDVFDNSADIVNSKPGFKKLFSVRNKTIKIIENNMPEWAKPLASIGLKYYNIN